MSELRHDSRFGFTRLLLMLGVAAICFAQHAGAQSFNNIVGNSQYGMAGRGWFEGLRSLQRFTPGTDMNGNVLISRDVNQYPFPSDGSSIGNYGPATPNDVGFVDFAGGNLRLAATSPYKGKATDFRDPGADIDAVEAATIGAVTGVWQ